MKVITIQRVTGPADYNVYENKEEFDKTGIELKTFRDAIVGDYIKSSNGFYVPVVAIKKFQSSRGAKTVIYRYSFPRQQQIVHKYKSSGDVQKMSFVYDVFCKHGSKPRSTMSNRTLLMLRYLEAGWDLLDAFNASYNVKGTFKRMQSLTEVLSNEKISEYIRKSKKMNELKQSFKKNGVNETWLAKKCKEILEDSKAQASLKIRALEMARDVLSIRDTNTTTQDTKQDEKMQLTEDLKKKIKKID